MTVFGGSVRAARLAAAAALAVVLGTAATLSGIGASTAFADDSPGGVRPVKAPPRVRTW